MNLSKKIQKKDSLADNDKIKAEYLLQGIQQIIIDEEKRKTKLIKSAAIAFPILSIIAATPLLAVAGAKKGIFKINNSIPHSNRFVHVLLFQHFCA